MNHVDQRLLAIAVMFGFVIIGCSNEAGPANSNSNGRTANRGEHDRDGESHHGDHGEEGEESGAELGSNETYDKVRNGARLILAYDEQTNSFNGTVENTTGKTLKRVRVEVHLSNGKELGPTPPADLQSGEKRDVTLKATSKDFDGWTAHPEVESGEHGHGEKAGKRHR